MSKTPFAFRARLTFRQWADAVEAGRMPEVRDWLARVTARVASALEAGR